MKKKRLRIGILTQLEHTIQREVVRHLISFASENYGWEFELPRLFGKPWEVHRPFDAMIAWPSREELPLLRQVRVPLVCLGSNATSEWPCVVFDNEASGAMAARYFLGQGIKRLGVLLGETSSYGDLRAKGFAQVAQEAGVPCRTFKVDKYSRSPRIWPRFAENLKRWLGQTSQPAALMADTDLTGFLALPVILKAGINVPEELAMATIGSDTLLCNATTPALSSVTIPGAKMGVEAAKLLHALLHGAPSPATPLTIGPIHMVERGSSTPLFLGDELVAKAQRLIKEHATEPFTIHDLLGMMKVSRRSLEIRFKNALGRTLQKEIWRVRLERAKQLLGETQLAMPDIADRSGFTDAQRLSEVFKRELHESPTDYRKRCQRDLYAL